MKCEKDRQERFEEEVASKIDSLTEDDTKDALHLMAMYDASGVMYIIKSLKGENNE